MQIKTVKIYGAGSIGNHMAHASRSIGWSVDVVDTDAAALERMKTDIYPSRYGEWDDAINLNICADAPKIQYDMVIIGTPPSSHIPLAIEAIEHHSPKAILIEKPLCPPSMESLETLKSLIGDTKIFVGYDHTVGRSCNNLIDLILSKPIGDILTIDVEFREEWSGIFKAHHWLEGPHQSYLGFWKEGGGASGEHSHALNMWQHLARNSGFGEVTDQQSVMSFVKDDKVDYDDIYCVNLTTESGKIGRVVQDVITKPSKKWARLQGTDGYIEWHCNYQSSGSDAVILFKEGMDSPNVEMIEKTRPDDFIQELNHIADSLDDQSYVKSPITLENGIKTMKILQQSHLNKS